MILLIHDSDGSLDHIQRVIDTSSESEEDSDNDDLDVGMVEPVWSATTSSMRPIDFL